MAITRNRLLLGTAGVLWVALLAAGLVGVALRQTTGHELAGYSTYVPWGLGVSTYIYLVGLSAGTFLVSSLIYVFGMRRLEPVGKIALFTAAVTLLGALLSIWFDIGHMERFWYVYVYGRPTSMMAWMVWLYTAYLVLIVAELWIAMRADLAVWARDTGFRGAVGRALLFAPALEPAAEAEDDPPPEGIGSLPAIVGQVLSQRGSTSAVAVDRDRRVLQVLGAMGVPLAVAFHGGVGALFGVAGARPFWNATVYPILFLSGALASGGALLTFIVAALWPERGSPQHRELVFTLGRITLALLVFDAIVEWAEGSISVYAGIPSHVEPWMQVLFGHYFWVFWILHVLLGVIVPATLLFLRPRSLTWVGAAAFLIATTFISVRLNIVIPGLVVPELEGLRTAFQDSYLTFEYFPSVMEWLLVFFVGAVVLGLFFAGYRALPLVRREAEEV